MRSFRRACGVLAVSAPLALSLGCSDPELASDLVTEGPPEVVEVNVLSESVAIFGLNDPLHLKLGEEATFCREGTDYKVNTVYCPEERDATNKPIPGQRGTDPVTDALPAGWNVRLIFDELLDPSVEDLVELEDGTVIGTLADTQPVTLTCGGTDVAYDGFYDPSGNHLSYPPGPGLVIQSLDFVATGTECEVSINSGEVTDKDGNPVPSAQAGPYEFAIAPLSVYGVSPADMAEGIALDSTIDVEFNAPIDLASVAGNITVTDSNDTPVAGTLAYFVDPADPDMTPDPFVISFTPDAPLAPMETYTVTIESGIADIAGGQLTLDEPIVVTFTTRAAS